MSDEDLLEQGIQDFLHLGFAQREDISDGAVVKLRNVYPVYQVGYQDHVQTIRQEIDPISNLLPFGRGGIHRYNNTDHSMMTAMLTVKNLVAGERLYDVFQVNQDAAYHEEDQAALTD
jgi:protoporphyrinogen oxidase